MKRLTLAFVACLALTASASAGRAVYSCSAPDVALAYPDRTGWYLTATVPAKATVNAILTGAGAPENEWSNYGTTKQGNVARINGTYNETLFTTTGVVTVQLVDVAADGSYTPITSCSFTVT